MNKYNYVMGCLGAIREMRAAGLNDSRIAILLSDIRAAAISEERMRFERLMLSNPPEYPPWHELRDTIKEITGEEK